MTTSLGRSTQGFDQDFCGSSAQDISTTWPNTPEEVDVGDIELVAASHVDGDVDALLPLGRGHYEVSGGQVTVRNAEDTFEGH